MMCDFLLIVFALICNILIFSFLIYHILKKAVDHAMETFHQDCKNIIDEAFQPLSDKIKNGFGLK